MQQPTPQTNNVHQQTFDRVVLFFEKLQDLYPDGLGAINEDINLTSTYTAAMAAMVFISEGKLERAQHIFDIFSNSNDECLNCSCIGGFQQFHDPATGQALTNTDKNDFWVGDNAWLLVALKYYKSVANDNQYNALIEQLKNWFVCLEDESSFPGIHGGYQQNGEWIDKHPEGSIDVYGALNGLGEDAEAARQSILTWINQEVWVPDGDCYQIGPANMYNLPLDNISWAVLALGEEYECLLTYAEERLARTLDDRYIIDSFDRPGNWHLAKDSDDPSIMLMLDYGRQDMDSDLVVRYSWDADDEWFLFFREEYIDLEITDEFRYFVDVHGDGSGNQFEIKLYNERSEQGNEAIFWYTIPLDFNGWRTLEISHGEFANFVNPDGIPLSHIKKIEFAVNNTSDTLAVGNTIRIGEIWYEDDGYRQLFTRRGFAAFESEKNWLFVEGIGQMAAAYCAAGQSTKRAQHLLALYAMRTSSFDDTALGLPTFITGGANHSTAEAAATAWYAMAYRGINPFDPEATPLCFWKVYLPMMPNNLERG